MAKKMTSVCVLTVKLIVNNFCCFTDIDECADSELNICHENATCKDEIGSYLCVCNAGFEGDGATCVGKFLFIINNYLFCALQRY